VSEDLLGRARAGDENAFRELVEPYRSELQLHCYRILGSVQDAEDYLQETLLAAWRGLDRFEGRASLRAWLYRIATNRCLNALRDRKRRPQEVSSMVEPPEPTRLAEPTWLEPYPDVLIEGLPDTVAGPEARYETRESVGLAFVAALQHLPPRQRVALVMRDVLGFDTAEAAAALGSSEASVKGALQRARATLEERLSPSGLERAPVPGSARERELVGHFASAVERGDTTAISPPGLTASRRSAATYPTRTLRSPALTDSWCSRSPETECRPSPGSASGVFCLASDYRVRSTTSGVYDLARDGDAETSSISVIE
jgi:RNA polymerase sigma-70 factor (ECF subfamily)